MMNEAWKTKKKRLINLIREVSDLWGGDDEEWLFHYQKATLDKYRTTEEMGIAIACFEDLKRQALFLGRKLVGGR